MMSRNLSNMSTQIPKTMRAVALSKYCEPSEYELATLPVPGISEPDEVLIKVKAASVNPIDVKLASKIGKLLGNATFPYKMGFDVAGVVVGVGSSVSNFKAGDEVYSLVSQIHRGTFAEYALSTADAISIKPQGLSFGEAASIPLVTLTALRSFRIADEKLTGGLKGKTVFIPAGLSGTGSSAIQLAKNVFGAGKVVTTLSAGKIEQSAEYLGHAVPDEIIDYTKENVVRAIGKGTVDFMFDTVSSTIRALPVMKRDSVIVSISTVPNGAEFNKTQGGNSRMWFVYLLNVLDWLLKAWTRRKGVDYQFLSREAGECGEELNLIRQWIEEGKLKPIVGRRAKLSNVEEVRSGCQQVFDAQGGVGKFVIEID
ncbi:chaperonin 10-like protein [Amylocarpus encephaloides]|uniref:Chaperonin 10-like protein n=1 Tax=Amylocarpus encephaloides TaxID=45428 RepID=A0A9P7YMC5_9HELO|nr:chaperonin 10-like protein [Amylocarpus encephaloides]